MGLEGVAVGAGPKVLLEHGADRILATRGMPAQVVHTRKLDTPALDQDKVVDVNRQIAQCVEAALEQESFPVTLAGNCNSCLGTLAAMNMERVGVIWLDRHGDFHTPESTVSGSLEGMALAIALGHCHDELRERIGLHQPPREQNTLLLGAYDFDGGEPDRLAQSFVTWRPPEQMEDLGELLKGMAGNVDGIYLHIDTDFLLPGAEQLLRRVLHAVTVTAVNVTNYNPQLDGRGEQRDEILGLLETIAVNAAR
jgi:arginase